MDTYRRRSGGYTIIEVVIVLTVSAMVFATAVTTFGQQNRRTQFSESVNNFAQEIQDVLNDVETGFYPSDNSFTCSVSGNNVNVNFNQPNEQGKNDQCIFLGKGMYFSPSGQRDRVDIYTIMGRRMHGTPPQVVTNIDDAAPRALNSSGLIESKFLTSGVEVYDVQRADDPGRHYAAVAIVSSSTASGAGLSGVNSRASLAAFGNSYGQQFPTPALSSFLNSASIAEASRGVNVCLQETGVGGRRAVLELAVDRSQIAVNVIMDQPCS